MTSRHALAAAALAALAALASFLPLAAQPDVGPKPPPAGHSYHGEAFDEGPRQKAYLMGGTGNVHLAVTTRSPQAQAFFDQGLGQLHGFWYFEAERSFRQAAALGPDCAMTYWGMAMANWENEKRARGFIERAVARKAKASRREQLWIDGLADYLKADNKDRKARRQQYLRSLETIIQDHPEDGVEARAFLAVRLWQFKGELPLPSLQAVDALLDQVFAANPMHPAHHYRIHLWDDSKPSRALGSAAKGGPAAPTIAHQWHMPGHTYAHLHRYADAAWQQEASARADHAHMIRDRVLPDQIHNYAHNQEWLVRDLNFIGRSRDAVALAKNLIELPRHPRYNPPTQPGRSAFYGRLRLLETLERFELWDDALALANSTYLEATDVPAEQVKRLRLLGLAHAGKGDGEALKKDIAELEKLAGPAARKPAPKDKLVPPSEEKKPAAAGKKRPPPEGKKRRPREASAETALNELKGCAAQLAGNPKEALELFKKVPGLSKERLARAHLLAGDKAKAEELAKQAAAAPDEVVPLAAYVEVLHACGKTREAGEAFARLRKLSGHIDNLEAPVFRRLAPVAKALGLPADWRQPAEVAADVGERPPLDSIGPFLWHPPAAPSFALREADGKPAALADYRGRPVLVIFYLGHGCLHCVEQLNRFGSRAKDFADLGISLVAVSPEAGDALAKSREMYRGQGTFPFRLLSDPKCEAFKTYRAYDDFENQPLHGAFLIDGRGLLRWHDVGPEPFNDLDFVLREAKRLLALPAPPAAPRGPVSARR
jgi:peroxiredoxin